MKEIDENEVKFYRCDLKKEEYELLLFIMKYASKKDRFTETDIFTSLNEIIQKPKKILHSSAKVFATQKATKKRTELAKKKIKNAVNLLSFEGKKVTYYQVAKLSGVHLNTVKKYITL